MSCQVRGSHAFKEHLGNFLDTHSCQLCCGVRAATMRNNIARFWLSLSRKALGRRHAVMAHDDDSLVPYNSGVAAPVGG